jgi:hypothetical protein
MKILPLICPSSTTIDLTGPASAWGLMPGNDFRFLSSGKVPMKSDVFVPGGPSCKCRLRRSGTRFH